MSEEYVTVYAEMLGNSAKMRAVRAMIEEIANTDAAVLLRGESGVGKCVVARAIHAASGRRTRQFVKVNCAALPPELLESELFGYERGAFTGAYRRKLGKFEFAQSGTILLDEIGELPPSLQAKLLHVLQDGEFSRVGGRETLRVDVRVVAATNRNLEAALASGQLREDFYYRLNVVEIQIPPLRERTEEIPLLAASFLAAFNQQYHRSVELPRQLGELFVEYPWPGNVRELENIVRRLVVLANPRQAIEELLVRFRVLRDRTSPAIAVPAPDPDSNGSARAGLEGLGLKEIARRAALEAERRALQEVLDRVRWNRLEASRILKVSYKTLLNKITECGLTSSAGRRKPPADP